MRYSLCYTSIRAGQMQTAVNWWLSKARRKDWLEFIISTDRDKPECVAAMAAVKSTLEGVGVAVRTVVNTDLPGTCVKGWNVAASLANGDVLIAMSDDFMPPPHWDLALERAAPWQRPAVLRVNDGYVRDLCTLAIVSRPRYERFGYLFYPGYESMFCDTELTMTAAADGCLVDAGHLLFEHLHPDCNKRQRDAVDLHHGSAARYETGRTLYEFRKAAGFPTDLGPRAGVAVTRDNVAAYLQVIRDDLCLLEVCERLIQEGVKHFFFHVPDHYWSGEPATPEDLASVDLVVNKLQAMTVASDGGAPRVRTVNVKIEPVEPFTKPAASRITVETRCRNAALDWVRKSGFEHILVVDGDELWKPGLLDRLFKVVNEIRPASVYTGMVPVIGLPGYPVDQATDKATIYLAPGVYFQECRGAMGHRHDMGGFEIYHFTATRRSMEEIVAKSRRSGHYDDADYDFEGWITNVLPKIGPGLRNAHMYKRYQVWKRVRAWFPSELAEIPATLHKYLGTQIEALPVPQPVAAGHSPHLSGRTTRAGWPKV